MVILYSPTDYREEHRQPPKRERKGSGTLLSSNWNEWRKGEKGERRKEKKGSGLFIQRILTPFTIRDPFYNPPRASYWLPKHGGGHGL
jgi:hypothetical protein